MAFQPSCSASALKTCPPAVADVCLAQGHQFQKLPAYTGRQFGKRTEAKKHPHYLLKKWQILVDCYA